MCIRLFSTQGVKLENLSAGGASMQTDQINKLGEPPSPLGLDGHNKK